MLRPLVLTLLLACGTLAGARAQAAVCPPHPAAVPPVAHAGAGPIGSLLHRLRLDSPRLLADTLARTTPSTSAARIGALAKPFAAGAVLRYVHGRLGMLATNVRARLRSSGRPVKAAPRAEHWRCPCHRHVA